MQRLFAFRWLVVASLVFTCGVNGQTRSLQQSPLLREGAPKSVGMSAERLARIDAMCQQAISEQQVPGLVALVARRGTVVYWKAFGKADNTTGRDMRRDDIFRIASQTKAVAATAAMILWEQGKFRLDDPISKYIPEFKDAKVLKTFESVDSYTTEPAKREITIRHLLTHTSGIGYGEIDGDQRFKKLYGHAGIVDAFCADPVRIEDNIKKLARMPLHHHPGERMTYSEGLDVIGYLVEIVSGKSFDRFMREHLLDPLHMNDTWFYLPDNKAGRLVPIQTWEDNRWTYLWKTFYDPEYPVKGARMFFSGGAGLSSTILDYANLLQMYVNKGELNGVRILSRTTVDTIMANPLPEITSPNAESYYGLAFGVLTPAGAAKGGLGSAGTFTWGGYFNTQYFADPKEQVIGLIFKQTQGTPKDRTGNEFRSLVFQAIDD